MNYNQEPSLRWFLFFINTTFNQMTVAELIAKLQEFPQDMEVEITDGFKWHIYKGDFPIQIFEDVDGTKVVDIGVGGFNCEE